jgi:hypothetical protein
LSDAQLCTQQQQNWNNYWCQQQPMALSAKLAQGSCAAAVCCNAITVQCCCCLCIVFLQVFEFWLHPHRYRTEVGWLANSCSSSTAAATALQQHLQAVHSNNSSNNSGNSSISKLSGP